MQIWRVKELFDPGIVASTIKMSTWYTNKKCIDFLPGLKAIGPPGASSNWIICSAISPFVCPSVIPSRLLTGTV